MKNLTELTLKSAEAIAREMKARALFVSIDAAPGLVFPETFKEKDRPEIFLLTRDRDMPQKAKAWAKRTFVMPPIPLTRLGQIKLGLMMALSLKMLSAGDVVVCVAGSPDLQALDTLTVLEIGRESEILHTTDLSTFGDRTSSEVFQAVLAIALELASQGREGQPLGTIFVIGDHERVYKYSRQMIINPFKGYTPKERTILDGSLRETIKEFASLDGAFVISGDGTVMCAGRHLNAAYEGEELPQGLGARHAAAAAITAVTRAVAVTVSQSTGTVTIFKDGKIFADIERP